MPFTNDPTQLVQSNEGLVYQVARKFEHRHDIDDLMQEGRIGLLRAAQDFNPKRASWSTYARYWVYAHIVRFAKRAKVVGGNATKRREVPVFSLNVVNDQDSEWLDRLESEDAPVTEHLEQQELVRQVREVAARLKFNERERYVVNMRLLRETPCTLEQIGDRFGFSRERVRQIEVRVLDKLKRHLREVHEEAQP